jgi:hypothetical protein
MGQKLKLNQLRLNNRKKRLIHLLVAWSVMTRIVMSGGPVKSYGKLLKKKLIDSFLKHLNFRLKFYV